MVESALVNGDCLTHLAALPDECADLVFADPPFNIGYKYDVYRDHMAEADYLAWVRRWIAQCARVLSPTGAMCVAFGDEYAAEYKVRLDQAGLYMRNWIIWHYTFGPHQTRKFGRDHAHILYYTSHHERFTFNAGSVRVESERQRAGDKRANPAGRVPGDVWTFARLPGNARERTGHPCQMPEAVLDRIIRATTNPGDLVIDPFGGSGTTLAVAKKLGRRWWGCELSPDYADGIRARLATIPSSEATHAGVL